MIKSVRQEGILKEVYKNGYVSSAELASAMVVSEITIRRDLDELDRQGSLKRVRGGAQRVTQRGPEVPVIQRQQSQVKEKRAIGQAALALVSDGDVIALESGTTTLEMARAIARQSNWQDLQVVTNSFTIFSELVNVPGIRIVFLGGVVSPNEMGTFGVLTEDMLKSIRIDKFFVGCRGIDTRDGISNSLQAEQEVSTVRAFVAASGQMIVLADHTKFGQTFLIRMQPVTDIDVVITDDQTPDHFVDDLHDQDVQLIVAKMDGEQTA